MFLLSHQVIALKKIRELCFVYYRTLRDRIKKGIQEITLYDFIECM